MKCKRIQRKLSMYIDEELDTVQQETVEAHLKECQTCQQAFEALANAWDLLSILPEAKPLSHFYTRLSARIASEKRERQWSWVERILVPASTLAVVVFGILMGSLVGGNGEWWTRETLAEEAVVRSLYLDSFDDFPSASLGEVYFNLADEE